MVAGPHLLQSEIVVQAHPETLGALKRSPYGVPDRAFRSVKDEMRQQPPRAPLSARPGPLFAGVIGYEDTVMPQLVNAMLSRHNFILLGLRGQAKSRILRALVSLLDDALPIVAGSEVNDNPFAPISKYARNLLTEAGDDTPIAWVGRENRYVEKLATPDVTIADLIGDLDPIRAARGGHMLSDELTIHYGMLPRANRGIFALNELPGSRRQGAGRIVQRHAGRRRPDQGLSDPPSARRAALLHGEPRGLHGARQDHHAAQGSHRQRDRHALSGDRRAGHGHHAPGGVGQARQPRRSRPGLHRRADRAHRVRGAQRSPHRQALGRVAAHADHGHRERRLQRRAARHRLRRRRHRAARVRHLRRAPGDHRQDRAGVRG